MNVGIISSKEYLKMARIMLGSLIEACSDHIDLYLFHLDLEQDSLEFINLNSQKMTIHDIQIDPSCFDGIRVEGHFGIFSYFRLLAPYVLPKEMERIIWLDTDLIIRSDISDYYNTPFKGNALIASPSVMNQLGKGLSEGLKNKYNVPRNSVYFNAGVLILNLPEMRKAVTLEQILDIAHKEQKELKYIDQDILNILFWDRCLLTSQYIYNFSPKDAYYDENINRETLKKAYIIHYCGKKKPTDFTYPDLGFEEYWSYAQKYAPIKFRITKLCHSLYDIGRRIKRKYYTQKNKE